jgi:hypothetical protein
MDERREHPQSNAVLHDRVNDLRATVYGGERRIGLTERMSELEKWRASISGGMAVASLFWGFVGTVLGGVTVAMIVTYLHKP